MKNLLLGLAILFLITSVTYCQESKHSLQRFDKSSPLELTIKSDKQVYEAGEPIKLIAEIKNISDSEVCMNTFGNDLKHKIILTQNDKQYIGEGPKVMLGSQAMNRDIVCIKPSESYKLEQISEVMNREVLVNVNNPIKTGIMNIKIEFIFQGTTIKPAWQGKLISNAIAIEVKERQFKNLFEKNFYQIKNEMSREQVISQLGQPLEKSIDTMPIGKTWGPQEGLAAILKPGAKFEEWEYQRNGTTYLIWFGSLEVKPEAEWKVIGKTLFPTGAVF